MKPKTHECWVYRAPKAMRDVLCDDCARGSKPVRPQSQPLVEIAKAAQREKAGQKNDRQNVSS